MKMVVSYQSMHDLSRIARLHHFIHNGLFED